MSLMLVYFELGKKIDMALPELPIVTCATNVRLSPRGLAKLAYVMTDGHSSERFLSYGPKVVGREGAKLRKAFVDFLKKRLEAGADPHFVLVPLSGTISDSISLTIEKQIDVRLADLETLFSSLQPNQLIRAT